MCLIIIGVSGLDDAYKQANREAQTKYEDQLTRGHMNPSGINSFNQTYMKNTFILVNAVPQFEASNNGPWKDFEDKIKDYAKKTCGSSTRNGTLYLLTGRSENVLNVTKPNISNSFVVENKTLRLDTPGAVWTAGCCMWMETAIPKAESFAVISNNHYDKTLLRQTPMKVTDLEIHLNVTTTVNLFPGNPDCAANDFPLPTYLHKNKTKKLVPFIMDPQ